MSQYRSQRPGPRSVAEARSASAGYLQTAPTSINNPDHELRRTAVRVDFAPSPSRHALHKVSGIVLVATLRLLLLRRWRRLLLLLLLLRVLLLGLTLPESFWVWTRARLRSAPP